LNLSLTKRGKETFEAQLDKIGKPLKFYEVQCHDGHNFYSYQYEWPNDKLPSVKRPFLQPKQEIPRDTISMPKLLRICTCSLCSSVELEFLF